MRSRWPSLVGVLLLAACADDRLVQSACRMDSHCGEGNLCENFRCIPASAKSCERVTEGNPVLQPAPYSISLGDIDVGAAVQKLSLHNIGNCTLTLFEAKVEGGPTSPFSCDLCAGKFPVEIFPGRKRDVEISFKQAGVGEFADRLVILSDDREFPELIVPLRANFLGVPDLRVAPNPVDFGYVAQGRALRKRVQVTNQGTGVAEVEVQSLKLVPEQTEDFSLIGAVELPATLPPVAGDPSAVLGFDVQYHPRSTSAHNAELVFATSEGEVRVPLAGNAATPPKISVSPSSIALGQVPLGHTNVLPLTVTNEGGVPLSVSYTWGGPSPSTDLFATPQVLSSVAAGGYVEMHVAVTATALGPINGFLVFSTNDPLRPSVTVPVSAEGISGPGPEVVKIELNYENGSDTAVDDDLRNVDLTLEHPYGMICNKQNPSPTNWGKYGNPSWISFGPKEEPERIILVDATQDGTYRVMVQYMEDCSSLPTDLLAAVLGISVDAAVLLLSGGAVNVDGKDVEQIVENTCLNHGPTQVTVRVWVNGVVIQEKTLSLAQKGDTAYAVELIRAGGKFVAQ